MSLSHDALSALRDWRAPDGVQESRRRRYVDLLERRPDALDRSCYPDHLTASTLVLSPDRTRVLLTLHAKARAWFQLGGHCEPGDPTLAGAALREATEESGITGLVLDPVPVQLSAHAVPFCDPRGGAWHLDVRFVAVAPAGTPPVISEESLDLRWWPVDALPGGELAGLVALALDRVRGRGQSASAGGSRWAADE